MLPTSKKHIDFSIIIPTFNRGEFLKLSLVSALRQKKVSFEIIVSDDCSTDDTEKVVKGFNDKRIKYIKNKKRLGTSLNFQKCFLLSRGGYIFTLGDDDFILEEDTLFEILNVMKKYKLGMGKIGTISYEKSPRDPYQVSILSDELIVLKPKKNNNILVKSINFGLGFYSGLVFNNLLLNKDKLKMDHRCYTDHMCHVYHPAAYDLIQKYGIAYIPNYFIVAHLSVQLIPRYFNIERHGRLFMEDPINAAKSFLSSNGLEEYKREFLRRQLILLPNIKYFSDNKNYIKVLGRLIELDKTLLTDKNFILLGLSGFMPKIFIKTLRNFIIYNSSKRTKELVKKYKFFEKIKELYFELNKF